MYAQQLACPKARACRSRSGPGSSFGSGLLSRSSWSSSPTPMFGSQVCIPTQSICVFSLRWHPHARLVQDFLSVLCLRVNSNGWGISLHCKISFLRLAQARSAGRGPGVKPTANYKVTCRVHFSRMLSPRSPLPSTPTARTNANDGRHWNDADAGSLLAGGRCASCVRSTPSSWCVILISLPHSSHSPSCWRFPRPIQVATLAYYSLLTCFPTHRRSGNCAAMATLRAHTLTTLSLEP